MIERCPSCTARSPGEAVCRRCGAELHWLVRVVGASKQQEHLAVFSLLQGDIHQALSHVKQAQLLKSNRLQQQLTGFLVQLAREKPT